MKGRKVAPKYRNPKNRSETWAGRGAMPRWMAAEIKKGKKREDFAIGESAAKAKRAPAKKPRRTNTPRDRSLDQSFLYADRRAQIEHRHGRPAQDAGGAELLEGRYWDHCGAYYVSPIDAQKGL